MRNRRNQVPFLILSLYVDDILIASNDNQLLVKEKQMLSQRFEMEDMGPATRCLGMQIERKRENRTLFDNQRAYLENVLKRFGMTD